MPAATSPATTAIPQQISPTRPHARLLHVKLRFKWRWHRATTRLAKVMIGSLPRTATVRIACHGKGTGCRARAVSAKRKRIARLIRALTGRTYRAGDRISVSVTARGYQPIHAQITIRFNKIPIVGLE